MFILRLSTNWRHTTHEYFLESEEHCRQFVAKAIEPLLVEGWELEDQSSENTCAFRLTPPTFLREKLRERKRSAIQIVYRPLYAMSVDEVLKSTHSFFQSNSSA